MADNAPDDAQFLNKKRNRKLSWVGVDEDTPYAYLRESMVSSLMGGICDPQFVSTESNPKYVCLVILAACSRSVWLP